MKSDLIILTTGSSGSSVLAGIIATQGYWLGYKTKKLNFDTYENARFVDLNMYLLRASGFKRRDCNDLPPPSIEAIKKLAERIDLKPFQDFLKECNNHQPWLWKDPRLSFTIHFWAQVMDMSPCKFILIDRDPGQGYAGLILNRKVPMSFGEQSQISKNYIDSCNLFLDTQGLDCIRLKFEDLILNTDDVLAQVNSFLNISLSMENIRSVYKGRLNRLRYSRVDLAKAKLIYLYWRYLKGDHIKFPREA